MAENMLGGIDFSQFGSWNKITAPTGATYYEVPGTGYVYDPTLSSMKGRPVLWTNPRPAYDQYKKQQQAAGPMGQITNLAGSTGGLLAGKWALDKLGPVSAEEKLAQAKLAQLTGNTTPASANEAFSNSISGVGSNGVQIGSNMDGSPIYQNDSLMQGSNTIGNSVPWGNIAQGVGGALQGYQGLQMWKQGDKLGGGLNAGAGAANIANSFGAGIPGYATGGLTAAAGAYNMYKGIEAGNAKASAMGGAGIGAGLGMMGVLGALGPVGWAAALLGGAAGGAALGHIKTGKSGKQQERDSIRSSFQKVGIADNDYNVSLADGSKFNIGLDGKTKYQNSDGKFNRNAYDWDLSNPLAQQAASKFIPFAKQFLGDKANDRQINATVGMLTNAATSNAGDSKTIDANVNTILSSMANQQNASAPPQQKSDVTIVNQPVKPKQTITTSSDLGVQLAKRMNDARRRILENEKKTIDKAA